MHTHELKDEWMDGWINSWMKEKTTTQLNLTKLLSYIWKMIHYRAMESCSMHNIMLWYRRSSYARLQNVIPWPINRYCKPGLDMIYPTPLYSKWAVMPVWIQHSHAGCIWSKRHIQYLRYFGGLGLQYHIGNKHFTFSSITTNFWQVCTSNRQKPVEATLARAVQLAISQSNKWLMCALTVEVAS